MTRLQNCVHIKLKKKQKKVLAELLSIIETDRQRYSDGKSRKSIIAQIMNYDGQDVYINAGVIDENMTIAIRLITGAE